MTREDTETMWKVVQTLDSVTKTNEYIVEICGLFQERLDSFENSLERLNTMLCQEIADNIELEIKVFELEKELLAQR